MRSDIYKEETIMAKFFNKQQQKKDKYSGREKLGKGIYALTPEEQARADKMFIPNNKDINIELMRKRGMSEKEIKEYYPDPLPQTEQNEIILGVRQLFGAHNYQEVIDVYLKTALSNRLSGDVLDEALFALGFSACQVKDKELIRHLAPNAVYYLMRSVDSHKDSVSVMKLVNTIVSIIIMAEDEVPGSMKEPARRLYPVLRANLQDDNPFIEVVQEYV